jgi:hypothetical protein
VGATTLTGFPAASFRFAVLFLTVAPLVTVALVAESVFDL